MEIFALSIILLLAIAFPLWLYLQSRLQTLEERIARLNDVLERLHFLEVEVWRLKQRQIPVAPPAVEPVREVPVVQPVEAAALEPEAAYPAEPQRIPPPSPPPPPPMPAPVAAPVPPPEESLETRVGLNWINRIGIVTLILGVAFFFKYAIDNAWIGESGRVVLGVLAGLASLWAGGRLWHRDQKVFAQGAMGLGLAILYLSFTAAFSFYKLVPQPVALVMMAMTTAAAGALSLRYNARAIAVLGLIGGYLTPLLLSTGQDPHAGLFLYLFVLNCGVVWLALERDWKLLHGLGLAATTLLFLSWGAHYFNEGTVWMAVAFSLVFFAQFALASTPWIVVPAQLLLTIGLSTMLLNRHAEGYAILSLIPVASALTIATWRNWRQLPLAAAIVAWLAILPWANTDGRQIVLASATVAFIAWLAWLPWQTLKRGIEDSSRELVLLVANAGFYFAFGYTIIHRDVPSLAGLFAVAVAAAHLAVALLVHSRGPITERTRLLTAGLALAFLTLAIPIQLSGYSITIAWAVQAAALAWISARLKNERVAISAGGVYLLMLARLCVDADLPFSNLFLNGHFFTFFAAAASLLAGAWWWRSRTEAAIPYFTGHLILIFALVVQLTGWAARNVDPANLQSADTAIVSLVLALFAIGFIGGGVATKTAFNRIAGLVLFGFIVVKLYLYDVWLFDRVYRVVAFLALGGLLVGGSYIYSHNRERINALWKTDDTPAI